MQTGIERDSFQEAARIWKEAKNPLAFTGAGISVPSGIPDFRSPGGLWSKYDPYEVATAQALYQNPKGVWAFLLDTVDLLEKSSPNPAHEALAALEGASKLIGVITQNIDNLHQRAGSKEVIEYHGNFQRFYCQQCGLNLTMEQTRKLYQESLPPLCRNCKGLIRPDVVFFGEAIPSKAHKSSLELVEQTDLIVIAGTSGEVAPANVLPRQVKMNGGKVIEINLGRTAYSEIADLRFDSSVDQVLPKIKDLVLE